MTRLVKMLVGLRNNMTQDTYFLDNFILEVMSGFDPEQALWNARHFLDFSLYTRCLEIIYFCK